ncbi:putative integral membrane protein (TIGR00698 family) [Arthrobacter stackebrandtii]|uniref:Integral membrane protein (TIGR00698 family) n=1 Tax=Arthrobacter stackebrandtii TaxID=272161 RepID=A0ABS4YSF3_9MICC|nr:putative sulfate exporter family transporter [Arthrobacter stackebrandtii]MBP2411694.1 putative integral membrane protein (TIGR00698 family) [Arthrobacter stackebrandtii]PYG99664.1 putative sulfate exporter family transporter [Arthrobacter stackebrandtii]
MATPTRQFPGTTAAPATAPRRASALRTCAAARFGAPFQSVRVELKRNAPGLLLCAAAVAAALSVNALLPALSPLIVAIVLGVVVANTVRLPEAVAPGIAVAAKRLLRWGIVFLGLQLVLSDIAALGAPMLVVIVCIVAGGIFGTVLMGGLLKLRRSQVLLIACGFSICGAAAVAGAEGGIEAEEEDVVTAVALVVIFGTLMIPLVPLLGGLLGMGPELNGMWAGGSIHEIAQVVAAGGIIGGGALGVAVVVKLARVLMLAPVMAVLSLRQRRAGTAKPGEKRPPIVPLFIVGFLAMVLLRSAVDLPDAAVHAGALVQTALLAAAMFALGCGVKVRSLVKVGARPFILAAASTLLVAVIALAGIELVHP